MSTPETGHTQRWWAAFREGCRKQIGTIQRWWAAFFERYGEPIKLTLIGRIPLWLASFLMVSQGGQQPSIALPNNLFLSGWINWDTEWYLRIIENGYTNIPRHVLQYDTVFLPLYPMLVRGVSWLTGWSAKSTAVLIPNVAIFFGMAIVYRWVFETKGPILARNTLLLMLCYPYTFFFSMAYTESLFLTFTALAIYAAHRQKWLISGLALACSSATRTIGLMAIIPVGLMYLQGKGWRIKKIRPDILFIALGICGLGGYILFLQLQFGDPLAFASAYKAPGWQAKITLEYTLNGLWTTFTEPFRNYLTGSFRGPYTPITERFNLMALFVATILSLVGWRRLGVPLLAWTVSILCVYWGGWISAGRYLLVHFPLFLLVAQWTLPHPHLYRFLLFTGGALAVALMTLFNYRFWVA